ncbi:MAG: DUF1800 domain-containing protein [Hyphomicrobiaceae bacterium]|nr:DUF1800 domain-containing protein [Hyphomicrobiaceae bacterium]
MAVSLSQVALRRFGLGPRPGDDRRVGADPRGYVLAALADRRAALIDDAELRPSWSVVSELMQINRAIRAERRGGLMGQRGNGSGAGAMRPGGAAGSAAGPGGAMMRVSNPAMQARRMLIQTITRGEFAARVNRTLETEAPFLERLVQFWSNHFCVSAARGLLVRVTAGAYEREAIRPHVLGRFADMLRAAEQHPAMLDYLDSRRSVGPNSRAGLRRRRGLNENHAREILELHTLGADGGYTQDDVTNLARILTGWTIAGLNSRDVSPGAFAFRMGRHEPGNWTVLGRRYADDGRVTGERVLDDLARHPATARHIARKLAVHFVSERPPAALVDRLAATFVRTDGDLAAVARALVTSPEAWAAPAQKILPPLDFVVSTMRAFQLTMLPLRVVRVAGLLGQPLWRPPSPKGWPDGDNTWAGPSALRERLRMAERAARMVRGSVDPRLAAEDLFGSGLDEHTAEAIARAETRVQGFELMIMSPGFQRR